jgi:hypothetical protein
MLWLASALLYLSSSFATGHLIIKDSVNAIGFLVAC